MAILNKLKSSREATTDPQTFAALVYKSGNRPGHSLGRSFLVASLFEKSEWPWSLFSLFLRVFSEVPVGKFKSNFTGKQQPLNISSHSWLLHGDCLVSETG
jgi:hypothetical protein